MSSTTTVPQRTVKQRRDALREANRIRTARKEFKLELKGDRTLTEGRRALLAPDADTATMKVYDLLIALDGVGPTKANAMLRRCSVSPSKTLVGLSLRQRGALGRELNVRARGRWYRLSKQERAAA